MHFRIATGARDMGLIVSLIVGGIVGWLASIVMMIVLGSALGGTRAIAQIPGDPCDSISVAAVWAGQGCCWRFTITNNQITNTSSDGMELANGIAPGLTSTLNAVITGNNVHHSVFGINASGTLGATVVSSRTSDSSSPPASAPSACCTK